MKQSNYDQLKQTLAPERIEAYGTSSDSPEIIFARYLLNMALCESLYSPLQFAEIALRNSIHQQLSSYHETTEWYRLKAGPWLKMFQNNRNYVG